MNRPSLAALFIGLAYFGTYFIILSLPYSVRLHPPFGCSFDSTVIYGNRSGFLAVERVADFHGIPSVLFAPVHTLDRHWFRRNYWKSSEDLMLLMGAKYDKEYSPGSRDAIPLPAALLRCSIEPRPRSP